MQDTRQQILEILKRHGEVTVQELSRELGLTSVTVRHHLEILRSEGYITEPEVRRSNRPGRPRYVYRLTSMAADLFPNNYSGLANALLEVLQKDVAPQERQRIIEGVARQLASGAGELPEAPEERLDSIISYIKQLGFVARWEKGHADDYHIYICNCPYHYVAQNHPETCTIDEIMLRSLTGAHLERIQGRASHNAICGYEVIWPDRGD
ncbi:MAG: ArsR family transcriptional regulator [Anaerolineae bacterium]|nr:ArsR family transcriptional regulator [Anaerolineae bacterium]